MWVEKVASDLWKKISKSEKVAFLAAFVSGILAHLYIWTNTIPNFDGLSRVYEEQQMTLVGRWFLHYASSLHDYTQMPMLIGVLAMLLLALATMLTIRLFDVKSSLLAGFWGVLAAVFPTVAYINTYTFTAVEYCFAILMSVISVYLVRKKGMAGWICGSIVLALTMGTYQAFVCVAITLSVLLIIFDMLNGEVAFAKAVRNGFVHVFYIGTGTVIYYIMLQIFLKIKDLQVISYLGMDMVADGYPLEMLGSILMSTYKQVIAFFLVPQMSNSFANKWMVFLHLCIILSTIVSLVIYIWGKWNKRSILGIAGAGVLFLVLPMAMNFVQIMSPYSTPTPIMKYAYIFVYFLPILLLDKCADKEKDRIGVIESAKTINVGVKMKKGLIELVLVLSLFFSIFYYWKYDNLIYNVLNQAHRASLSFVTNVVGRVESCEGYQYGMPVVVIGGFPADRYFADVENYDLVQQNGVLAASVIPLNKHIYYYMNDWLNVPIAEPAEEMFLSIAATEEFAAMPLYPNDGSVKMINGCVVVKMQSNFTPKAQYEKDYENRR